jgi:hypothetical protein
MYYNDKAMKLFKKLWGWRWGLIIWLVERFWKAYKRRAKRTVTVDQSYAAKLPGLAYTLGGRPMEPINFILIGSEESLNEAFMSAGWIRADYPTPFNLLRALFTIIFDRGYPAGPVTPLQVDNHVQDLAFQKPTRQNRFRRRHHIRIWKMPHKSKAGQIWIASGSYDEGFKVMLRSTIFTHIIGPNLDAEREFVINNLCEHGAALSHWLNGSAPKEGKNAFGDRYHSDGRLAVLEFGNG